MGPSSRTLGLDLSGKIFLFLTLFSFPFLIPYLTSLLTHICLLSCPSFSISQITPLYFIPFPLSPFYSFNVSFFFSFGKAHYWFVRTIIFFLLFYAHTKSLSYAIHTGPRTSVRFFFYSLKLNLTNLIWST